MAADENVDILIAEDSRIQAKMLQKRLEDAGYCVRWGENGAEALALLKEQRPTLIISDIEMPVVDGYEFCETVKSDPDWRTIPLILLSTLSSPEDIIQGLHVGADNYVTKPYDPEYLLTRVESLLKTPLTFADEEEAPTLDVTLAGKTYSVKSGRQQVLNLLVSTFENAVEKNNELIRVNQDLSQAKDTLEQQNDDLEELNAKINAANERMTDSLNAAADVQQSLLPQSAPETDVARFAWEYIPCDELAGDFLNTFRLDEDHIALFVVDVSGHGVPSSLLSVAIGRLLAPHATATSLLVQSKGGELVVVSPALVVKELNERFQMEEQGGLYFTIVYGVLNTQTGEFRYASGGHPPIVQLSDGQEPKLLDADGFAVGWVEEADFDEYSVTLKPGERLILYSDGIPEAMDADLNQLGDERMLSAIKASRSHNLNEQVGDLLQTVKEWCHENGPKDDVSILAVEWVGSTDHNGE